MRFFLLLVGILSISFCFGCKSSSNSINEVKIGVIVPETGNFAAFGKSIKSGIMLYKKNYELEHPGKKIDFIIKNNNSDALTSMNTFKTLVLKYKVPVIIGPYSTANTFALKPLAKKYGVPVISPTATNDQVTVRNPYIFRTCYSDSYQAKALGWYTSKKMNIKKIGILVNVDAIGGDYSRGLARAVGKAFKDNGGKVVLEEGFHHEQKSFVKSLEAFKKAGAEAVFAPLYPDDIKTLLKDIATTKFDKIIFGGDSWSETNIIQSTGSFNNKFYFSCMFAELSKNKAAMKLIETAAVNRIRPNMAMAQGYDTAGILVSIMNPLSSSSKIALALGKIKDYQGATGPITIKPDGNAVKDVFIKEIFKSKASNKGTEILAYVIKPGDIN